MHYWIKQLAHESDSWGQKIGMLFAWQQNDLPFCLKEGERRRMCKPISVKQLESGYSV
jgi:hypothetical protein